MPSSELAFHLPSGRQFDLTIENEQVVMDSMIAPREPDPDWVFIDSHGHKHRWPKGGRRRVGSRSKSRAVGATSAVTSTSTTRIAAASVATRSIQECATCAVLSASTAA